MDQALAGVLEGGQFILGREVSEFESEFAAYCGVSNAAGVGSGTEALHLALWACGIGQGDEVILPAHTAVATVAAVELAGARPVLADIDARTYTLDPERVEAAITPRTRLIVPVHLYGCPADMDAILEIANRKNLFVLEDCAQAHGALYHGRKVGSLARIAAFSFYPTKNLGAYGDGGAVLTDDPALDQRARLLRQYGWEQRYVSRVKGMNSRLDELQAALLRVKLRHLDRWNVRRRELARLYSDRLAGAPVILPVQPEGVEHVFHQFVIRHPQRDRLRAHLDERGIQTLIHYPVPVHLQPAYQDLDYKPGDLPQAELAARQVLSLPLHPELTDEAVIRVCEAILDFSGFDGR